MKSKNAFLFLLIAITYFSCDKPKANCSACPKSISGYEVIVVESPVNSTVNKQLTATCPEGKRTISCGWSALDSTSAILSGKVTYSEPSFDGKSWMVNAENESSFSPKWKLRLRCICGDVAVE